MTVPNASLDALFARFLQAISDADVAELREVTIPEVRLDIPGPAFVDITCRAIGNEALCDWANRVRAECGKTEFVIHRYFENGCEVIAKGKIRIEHFPRAFESLCACHISTEAGKIVSFQVLLDTYALQKFRGQAD